MGEALKKALTDSKLSVLSLAAFGVYMLTMLRSLDSIKTFFWDSVPARYASTVALPGIEYFILVFHTILVMRLYVHAWGVDVSPAFKDAFKNATHLSDYALSVFEWTCRLAWVMIVSYLPIIYSEFGSESPNAKVLTLVGGYIVLFSLVMVWDMSMFRRVCDSKDKRAFVVRSTNPGDARRRLWKYWIAMDFAHLAGWVILFLIYWWPSLTPLGLWPVILFVCATVNGAVVAVVQMYNWVPEIVRA